MIDVENVAKIKESRIVTRLLTWNNIERLTHVKASENDIDKKSYTFSMQAQYVTIFEQGQNRFKRLLNNSAQPDINELLFFSKYLKVLVDDLIEQPRWSQ